MIGENSPFERMDKPQSDVVDLNTAVSPKTLADINNIEEEQEMDFGENQGSFREVPTNQKPELEEKPATEEEVEPDKPAETEDLEVEVGNVVPIFAKRWKEEGKLSADFEITDDLTDEDLEKGLYEFAKEKTYTKLKSEIYDEISTNEGLTPEAISAAKMLFNSIEPEEIQKERFYRNIASVELDSENENYEAGLKELGTLFYEEHGFSRERALINVNRDLEDYGSEKIQQDYQNFFIQKSKEVTSQIKEKERVNIQNRQAEAAKAAEQQEAWFTKGEIGGVKYTKEQMDFVKKAIYDKTELIIDEKGNKRFVTLEHKKILDAKKDPEKYFQYRTNFILGYSPAEAAAEAKVTAKNTLIRELNKAVTLKPKANIRVQNPTNKVMQEEEQEIDFSKTYNRY
jgi:hypothetical protein